MSFTFEVKEELARVMPRRDCCRRSELSALRRYGDRHGTWVVDSPAAARKVITLSKHVWGQAVAVRPFSRGDRHRFVLSPNAGAPGESADELEALRAPCCRRAFLRGVFEVAGWVADPYRGSHLELSLAGEEDTALVQALLAEEEITARRGRRQGGQLLYVKSGEQVVRFLNLTGAHGAVMRFENVRVLKEVKNLVNRLVNADTANVGKTVEAAARQIEDIRAIVSAGLWERMPPVLQQAALARLRYPEVTIRELGEFLQPPVGKSGMNHRLRRLHGWAERARQKASSDKGPGPTKRKGQE